jgi:hypothetical protein
MSLNFVWPETIQRPALIDQQVIFCAIPHGAAPLGITAYPMWSKLFNSKLCHWTCAPIVLKLPLISKYMKQIGYIPAKSKHIIDTLTKKEENVGIILDGIAGMFQTKYETAHINQRKGIIKIALRAGTPIVPIYGMYLRKTLMGYGMFLDSCSLPASPHLLRVWSYFPVEDYR